MSQQESDGSYVVSGAEHWDRVRHFTDGRDPVEEAERRAQSLQGGGTE